MSRPKKPTDVDKRRHDDAKLAATFDHMSKGAGRLAVDPSNSQAMRDRALLIAMHGTKASQSARTATDRLAGAEKLAVVKRRRAPHRQNLVQWLAKQPLTLSAKALFERIPEVSGSDGEELTRDGRLDASSDTRCVYDGRHPIKFATFRSYITQEKARRAKSKLNA